MAQRRWTQEDPLGYAGGRNLYAYVDGQVAQARDPDGLRICSINFSDRCDWARPRFVDLVGLDEPASGGGGSDDCDDQPPPQGFRSLHNALGMQRPGVPFNSGAPPRARLGALPSPGRRRAGRGAFPPAPTQLDNPYKTYIMRECGDLGGSPAARPDRS